MSISQLVPLKEAEIALLEELQREGRPMKTGELVRRAIKHFPAKLTPLELQRRTPSGTPWWPGRFRYDLNRLRKMGEARSSVKGYWEITRLGSQRINSAAHPSGRPRLSDLEKGLLDWTIEVIEAIKSGEVQAIVRTESSRFTVELGDHIRETQIEVEKPKSHVTAL